MGDCPFPFTNEDGGTLPCDVTFAERIGSDYLWFRNCSLGLWTIVLAVSSDRGLRLLIYGSSRYEHVRDFQQIAILCVWACAISGFVASVDPQGYDNIVGPVTNQIASDVTTSSLAALVVVFTFSFKQAATVSSNASLPERKRQQHVSVFLVFLIGPVGTPLMLLQNILLWRSMKLLWLTIVLLVSIATFSVDFLRVRSVLLQHLESSMFDSISQFRGWFRTEEQINREKHEDEI